MIHGILLKEFGKPPILCFPRAPIAVPNSMRMANLRTRNPQNAWYSKHACHPRSSNVHGNDPIVGFPATPTLLTAHSGVLLDSRFPQLLRSFSGERKRKSASAHPAKTLFLWLFASTSPKPHNCRPLLGPRRNSRFRTSLCYRSARPGDIIIFNPSLIIVGRCARVPKQIIGF
jgi:hypothetical protein